MFISNIYIVNHLEQLLTQDAVSYLGAHYSDFFFFFGKFSTEKLL